MSALEAGPPGTVLALNAGSSSLKFALFVCGGGLSELLRGEISNLGAAPRLLAHDAAGACLADQHLPGGGAMAEDAELAAVLALVDGVAGHGRLAGVGHRIVHGGADHVAPERVTPALLTALAALTPLDPMHMPHNLAPIRAVCAARPGVPQFACFDTAFHHTMPWVARQFALPREFTGAGIRRYGFHGLSCEYIVKALRGPAPRHVADPTPDLVPDLTKARAIIAHLGAGASLCAIADGKSIASTMGLSVLDGLVMATRCGSLDPGVIFTLGRMGHDLVGIEHMLYHRSGLLGVSGISGDMRVLLESGDPRAGQAVELYTYRIALEIGAMVAALGGLDGIVFTAGIGANSPAIRAAVCARLGWLGVRLDEAANHAGASRISAATSSIDLRVIATDEEAVIASHVQAGLRLLAKA